MMGVFGFDFDQENRNHIGNSLDLWAWQSISLLVALTGLFMLSWLDTVQIEDDYLLPLLSFPCPFVTNTSIAKVRHDNQAVDYALNQPYTAFLPLPSR